MMETEFLIVGAGLAGLSAAYHLKGRNHIIVESDAEVGGLCKTYQVDGFHFDCTGHLIHFRTPEGKQLLMELVGDRVARHERKAAIFLEDRYTPYPFQANTYGLPPEVVKECLLGFVQTMLQKRKRKIGNFQDWIHETFGDGIAKYFMFPYNEKIWQHDLRDIALDWVNWSIPKPNLEEVFNGALGIQNRQFGYNPVFFYPVQGGISLLPNSFPITGKLILDNPLVKVDLKKRRVTLRDGQTIAYRYLLSTMPLHALLMALDNSTPSILSARDKLKYISVLNINLGIQREAVVPHHWIYFPEKDKPFYRIGCPTNFSNAVAPAGTSSLFLEVSLRPSQQQDVPGLVRDSVNALKRCKILRDDDAILTTYPILLKYAYVIYNKDRRKTVEKTMKHLNRYDVHSFGRYGSWIYSSMEDAILEGKAIAEKLTSGT